MGKKQEAGMNRFINYLVHQKNSIIVAFLIVVILLGTIPIVDIKILGVVPTFYRVFIPLLALYFFCKDFRFMRKNLWNSKLKIYKILIFFVIFWLVYGVGQIFICSYVEIKVGVQELVGILLGAISALCIVECILVYGGFRVIINSVRAVVVIVTIIGILEMITCKHLDTSMLCSDSYLKAYIDSYGFLPSDGKISAMATGIFYNVNDFSAWLGVFSSLFFPKRTQKNWVKIAFFVELSIIALIALVNDAWICLIAMCIGGIVYLVLVRARMITCLATILWAGLMKLFVVQAFFHTVGFVYSTFFPKKQVPQPIAKLIQDGTSQVTEAIEGQIAGMETGRGSLSLRFNTYGTALKETFSSSFGLGFGPGSFSNYFGALNSTNVLLNPHSWWIEILFQYGIVVLIGFLAVLVYAFILLLKCWKQTQSATYAMILAMDVILVLISFAPSSFIGYSYLWIPIGLTFGVVMKERVN